MNIDKELGQQQDSLRKKQLIFLKNPKILALLIVIIAVISGVCGYSLGKNRATQFSTSIATVTVEPDHYKETSKKNTQLFEQTSSEVYQWKTFENVVVGYTIQYPEGIEVEKLDERSIVVARAGVPYGGQEGKVALGGMALYYRGTEGLDKGNDLSSRRSEQIIFNGYPALRVLPEPDMSYISDIFVSDSNNKRVIRISINTAGDTGFEESTYKLFHQIASTLTFTP